MNQLEAGHKRLRSKTDDVELDKTKDLNQMRHNGGSYEKNHEVAIVDNRVKLVVEPVHKFPVIRPDKYVRLYVNDEEKDDSVVVSNEVEIRIETSDQMPYNSVDIRVTEDKLKAYLTLNKRPGRKVRPVIIEDPYNIADYIVTTEEEIFTDDTEIKAGEVRKEIEEAGIRFGLKKEAISQAIKNPGEEFLIAEGKPPVPSVDAKIVHNFDEKTVVTHDERRAADKDGIEKIDYFGFIKIYSVKPGQILAVKAEPRHGKPGIDVYGQEIPVEEPKDIEWNIGEGVILIGNRAVATRSGRPVIENGKLSVLNIFYVDKDVDITVGSINYNGDVLVSGSVAEHFAVKATGLIKVGKNVSHATIEAGGDIWINGNIFGSKVTAGGSSAYYQQVAYNFEKLSSTFEEVEEAVSSLKEESLFKNSTERQLICGLFETKYKETREIISDLVEHQSMLAEDLQNPKILAVINELKIFLDCTAHNIDLVVLGFIKREVGKICRIFGNIANKKSSIYTEYVQNSFLQATGDIKINKKGAFNSTLISGGKVIIDGMPGVFRGGKIKAREAVIVRELGSIGGSKVEVEVEEDGKIIIDQVYDNVFIKIGGRVHRLDREMKNIKARLHKGEILL